MRMTVSMDGPISLPPSLPSTKFPLLLSSHHSLYLTLSLFPSILPVGGVDGCFNGCTTVTLLGWVSRHVYPSLSSSNFPPVLPSHRSLSSITLSLFPSILPVGGVDGCFNGCTTVTLLGWVSRYVVRNMVIYCPVYLLAWLRVSFVIPVQYTLSVNRDRP